MAQQAQIAAKTRRAPLGLALPLRAGERRGQRSEREARRPAPFCKLGLRRRSMKLWPLLLVCLSPSFRDGAGPEAARPSDGRHNSSSLKGVSSGASEGKMEAALRESIKRTRNLNSLSPNDSTTAFYGINQFSHLFPEEFRAIYLQSRPSTVTRYIPEQEGTETSLPARFDWRDKKAVTPVRNQETCGGCWAFSVVGSIESVYAMKGNVLEELSVQQVIDCSYNNNGCNGGSTISALNWLNQTHVKLVRDSKYPFKAETGLCHYFRRSDFGVSITGYAAFDFRLMPFKTFYNAGRIIVTARAVLHNLTGKARIEAWLLGGRIDTEHSGHEEEMMKILVKWGPVVAIVDAVSWQDYLGGVIQYHCSSGEANHAVLITGFDTTGSIPYWIVRNSWGRSWGIDGYAHVKIGSNVCGIADEVSSVFV